ncbi:MAG: hypothetical protein E3J81_03560 [Dehalococcoidia bacterium]|nr:MAG: hypothetical protein E3J81_03560 [Dehalococcoidia bacterium]
MTYRRSRGTTVTVRRTKAQIGDLLDSLREPSGKGIKYGFDNDNTAVIFQYCGAPVRLKVDSPARFTLLQAENPRGPRMGWYALREQADREAWRNLLDWLKISITLLNDGQFRFIDLFLPFVQMPETVPGEIVTLGDYFAKEGALKALTTGQLMITEQS